MNQTNKIQFSKHGRVNIATRVAQAESAVCIGALLLAGCTPGLGRMPVRLIAASRPLDGWLSAPDTVVRNRLERVWKDDRAFYDRLAPGIRIFEVDDDNALAASASEELILDQAIELLIRYRTCCGPLAMR